MISDQLEAAAAEASADAELWRDLPSSDYSESLRELAGMASKSASQVRFDVENRGAFT